MALKTGDEAVAFVKELGGDATTDEIAVFLKEKSSKTGELSEAELQQVAGGKGPHLGEAIGSIITAGLGCAIVAIDSAIEGRAGTAIKRSDRLLCEDK